MKVQDFIGSLPAIIRIGPFDFKLLRMDALSSQGKRRVGECSCREGHIGISEYAPSKLDAVDTLCHEINHAIFYVYGIRDNDDEERTSAVFATAWVGIYRDNPWLLDWIANSLKGD